MIESEPLLEAVVARLQANLNNLRQPTRSVGLMVDEKVPPGAGEEYIGVYLSDSTNLNPPSFVTKRIGFGFTIGITRRMQGIPNELAGKTVLTYNEALVSRLKPSMYNRAKEIANILEAGNGWTLINEINAAIADATGCFIVPFGLQSISPIPRKVDEDHFDTEGDQLGIRYVGLLLELEFAGAEYYKVT